MHASFIKMAVKVDGMKTPKRMLRLQGILLLLICVSCQAHHSSVFKNETEPHWYTSIEGEFTVQTPTSLIYRQDKLTLKTEDKTFTMDLGVHHGQLKPWFFEIVHTTRPAFWKDLSPEEQGWWLKSMVQNRYAPFKMSKTENDRLWGEQNGRQLEVKAVTSATRLYLIVAAVPPGSLSMPLVQNFFQSFQHGH